ncbi:MAG: class D beta-lactamase [Bacteroidetes bacterium]|nr:class D beta-lactamase [Bacteroidota bacterium]
MPALPLLLLTALMLPLHGGGDPERHFREAGVKGSFLLCELDGDSCLRINPERCAQRFIPASTFKILNSMIALEYGAVNGLDDTLRWDGTRYSIESWNQHQCMRDAFQRSCVWFYQELARRIGEKRMKAAVTAVGYGNTDIGGGIDRFWLDGALRVSSEEQLSFLRRLWKEDLPFSVDVQRTVKELMVLERTDAYTLRGKTGTAMRSDDIVGWLVGFLDRGDHVYVYVLNLELPDTDDLSGFLKIRYDLLRTLLHDQGLI